MVAHVDKEGNEGTPIELGEWKINDDGYPLTLSYAGKSSVCDNKDELFDALTDFISNTSIAEKLKQTATPE
ncbi:hypothetical protein C5610_05685 [Idiomarina sp. OT37-5b]|nr:hypothetical protein C5610_05685 [Idiomarina sp. OT37-5b]